MEKKRFVQLMAYILILCTTHASKHSTVLEKENIQKLLHCIQQKVLIILKIFFLVIYLRF